MIDKIYGFLAYIRRKLYKKNILKQKKLPKPVISIGNLSVGGTGKTPITISISKYLKSKGLNVVVLSRGYKRKTKQTLIVSEEDKGYEIFGDEPYLMFKKGIPVVVSSSRYDAGILALEKLNPDIFILDDGFQHFQLYRDIDILVIDLNKPFWEDKLLPFGRLREPKRFYKYADLFLITKWKTKKEKLKKLKEFNKPYFLTEEKINRLTDFKKVYDFDILKDKKIIAFAGLGNNKYFFETVKNLAKEYNFKIEKFLDFPDHYNYKNFKKEENKIYITTEKDLIKFKDKKNIYALEYQIEIPEDFKKYLDLKLNQILTKK